MTPARYLEFEGKMYSSKELEQITGYTRRYINQLVRAGLPIRRKEDHVPLDRAKLHPFGGEELTAVQIAERLGVDVSVVCSRLHRGSPLDAPVQVGKSSTRGALLESGEHEIGEPSNGENGLYWADDIEARVWHLHCGGDDFGECTLAEIAALWGLSRERVRQIEDVACRKIRMKALRGNKDAQALMELFKMRQKQRSSERPGVWEQASMNSPGNFDLSEFRNKTSYVDIARKFGHAEYETQSHVVASRAAAARRARRA